MFTAQRYDTEALIVGAGPIGLTLAALLAARGIETLVVESHPGLSRHPKARGVSARSMETFRTMGIEEQVRAASLPSEHVRFFRGETLNDPNFELSAPPGVEEPGAVAYTPAPGVLCSQDQLEPVLLDAARSAGARVWFSHRVVEVGEEVDEEEPLVRVKLLPRDGNSGTPVSESKELRARYLIACDGAKSTVRESMGISSTGEIGLATFLSIRFTAQLGEVVRGREATSYFLSGGKGGFLAVDNDTEWIYQYPIGTEAEAEKLANRHDELLELVRVAAGIPDLEIVVADTMIWRMDARIADHYRKGRVILAGDAAHQTPPTGGHGMNVGIGDAETLAWQLAAVLRGSAGSDLLDDYERDRRPVGAAVIARSLDNASRAYGIDDELLLGTAYLTDTPIPQGEYRPSIEQGRRLPHVPLRSGERIISSLDVIGPELTLVSASPSPVWLEACAGLVEYAALIGAGRSEQVPGTLAKRVPLNEGEALLVRPDGHIAARLHATSACQARERLQLARAQVLAL
ncbi:FAD-dependent monooxygenase [Leucobacter sp. UT-8R-CII-1-4]|uniref:FAD-dependent monooxygenase n=1 Tax=Leucobacter sp. UT-8R-CII-1-4 TaxID=3040075 RepID=UPI0024A991EF|nr:FAD-dependent monooxygenase [Leucobacter sp. UT-8R-CII-1-4]MDI6021963.1 FAD-dependent monooxygenase [Leucobacter sp. UT-8R-CII-1-4]